ncbi:COG4648 family protein [Azohydromonas caseinilytica]|uniref:Transmembrane protein n=1 Tax=Azohydromonas caseinilytica TaxID=2728836 RepID=A0A848FJX1_9BURK|nr:hypothetical protein [Azohydromonas caseinilytica]NML18530.1 hypothetical protein [Azohydromonas caseinilytica]
MTHWQLGLALLGVIAYSLLSHVLMLHAAHEPWAVAALLGPLLAMVGAVAWRGRHRLGMWAVLLAALALLVVALRGGVGDVKLLYLVQHAGVHAALGASFGLTLAGPGPSAIGRVAQQVHGTLQPGMARYTWHVTLVWTLYFFAMATGSVALYLWGPWDAWSLLANLVTPVAIAVLFVGEHLLRYRLHPEFERVSLLDTVRAYRNVPADR